MSKRAASIKKVASDLALLAGIICAVAMIQNLIWALILN
jgi:hypothetical protein